MNLDAEGNTEELARLASQGDPDSVAALARRSIPSLFDFAVRVTLDETTAKAVVESTLNRALGDLANRPPNLGFRTWMFGIARDEALDAMRARGREGSESGQISPLDERFTQLDDQTGDSEVALWTWQAARAQRPRDYSLLDLAIRRRVPPEEIADIASLSRSGIYAVLGRLRGAFEESFFTSTLYFRGRPHCAELDKLVTEATSLGPALRRDIGRHADSCAVCKETRNGLTLAADILGSFTNVDVPEDLLERLAPEPVAVTEPIEGIEAPAPEDGVAVPEDEIAVDEEPVFDEEPVVEAVELAAVLPAELALAGQTLEGDAAAVEEELLEEAAFLLPEVEPEAEPAEAAEEVEQPAVVPLAAGLAGIGGMTVLAAAEDALVAGSAATVVPHAGAAGNGVVPVNGTRANGAGATTAAGVAAAALLPAVGLPAAVRAADKEGALPALDDTLLPVVEPTDAIEAVVVPVEEPADTFDTIVVPVEGDEGVESAQAALAVADADPSVETSIEAPEEGAAEGVDPEALVAVPVVTEGATPDAEAVAVNEDAGEPKAEPTVVDDDGALTAVDESSRVEDSAGGGAATLIPFAAGAAAAPVVAESSSGAGGAVLPGGGGGRPPRARTAEGSEDGKSRGKRNMWLIGAIAVATVAAAYVGIALGDSIRSGGETPTQPGVVLPTRAPGVREVACGTAPISMQQGTRATLTFAAASLPNYEVSAVAVQPISPTARTSSVEATAQQGLSVLFEAFTVPPVPNQPANQVDEYRLVVTFSRDQERTSSECTVLVSAGAMVPTNTPAATPVPTEPPAATPTQPAPSPTTVSSLPTQIVPTPVPSATPGPTATPEPEAEPPTQTPVTANTPVPPTNTPTVTGTPPTATPPPTYTPTITPSPLPTATSTPFVPPPAP